MMHHNTWTKNALAVMSIVSLVACNSAPNKVQSLEDARAAYLEASQDFNMVKYAAEELDGARNALQKADIHWEKKDSADDIEHYVYLTAQRIEIARLIVKREEAEIEIKEMSFEREALNQRLRDIQLVQVLRKADESKREESVVQVDETDRGMLWTLGDVFFDVDKATLAPSAARNIAQIANFMRKNPTRNAVIEGHTDASGEDDHNMELSCLRAEAVRDALIDANIDASRLTFIGFGAKRPVANNASMIGKQANRRVEVLFPDDNMQVSKNEEG